MISWKFPQMQLHWSASHYRHSTNRPQFASSHRLLFTGQTCASVLPVCWVVAPNHRRDRPSLRAGDTDSNANVPLKIISKHQS